MSKRKYIQSSFNVKAFIANYAIGDQVNLDLLETRAQRDRALKSGMLKLEMIGDLIIFKRVK